MLAFLLYLYFLDRKRIWRFSVSIICCTILFITNYNVIIFGDKKCPKCFGDEFCHLLKKGEIKLKWSSIFFSMLNPKISKPVFYADFHHLEIVLKIISSEVTDEVMANQIALDDKIKNVLLCPVLDNFRLLYNLSNENIKSRRLWMDVQASIEPLLLQVLSFEENWPIPKYYGACGDVIIEEYKGTSLINYYWSDWKKRAYLALQLLKMANIFTFGHPQFAFYFTDISVDNLVVNSSGIISLVDLDHVIIVDKNLHQKGLPKTWNDVHVSQVYDLSQFSFSHFDICSHHLSDHNYFAVCQYILIDCELTEGGFLHDVPEEYSNVNNLVKECGIPMELENRILAGDRLAFVLDQILTDFDWKNDS